MNITSISFAMTEKKATVMNIKVLRKVSQTTYVIGDTTKIAILEVDEKIILKEETFVKLVKPIIKDNAILMNSKFSIIKGKYFQHDFKANDIETACQDSGKASEELKLIDIENVAVAKTIPCLSLKICAVSKPYNGKFSEFRNILAKDLAGSKVTVVLYKKLKDSCQMGKVYDFYKLKKTDYKGEGETHYRLSSLAETKVEEVFGARSGKFDAVNVGDNFVVGDFLGMY